MCYALFNLRAMSEQEPTDFSVSNVIKTEGKEEVSPPPPHTALKSPRRQRKKPRYAYTPLDNNQTFTILQRGGAPSWGSILCVCVAISGIVAVLVTFSVFASEGAMKSHAPVCQLKRQPNSVGEGLLNDWQAVSCQRVYKCSAQSAYLIDRTCTVEDMTVPLSSPVPRGVDVLVSKDFNIVYVRNPTAVDAIVRYIMMDLFSAYESNSHVLTTQEVKEYFFFTFVERTLDRFSLEFTDKGLGMRALNATSSCDGVNALFPLAFSENWVPSQSYFLSGDAGSMNHMIRFNWIGDASDISSVLYLFENIQASLPRGVCLPEINFQYLNYEFIRGREETRALAKRFQGCMDSVTSAHILSYYRQDDICWFT